MNGSQNISSSELFLGYLVFDMLDKHDKAANFLSLIMIWYRKQLFIIGYVRYLTLLYLYGVILVHTDRSFCWRINKDDKKFEWDVLQIMTCVSSSFLLGWNANNSLFKNLFHMVVSVRYCQLRFYSFNF